MNCSNKESLEVVVVQCPFCAGRYLVYDECCYCDNIHFWLGDKGKASSEAGNTKKTIDIKVSIEESS